MEIRRIELCNINSLQGEWTLDFTKGKLASQDIFAIVGETGSGKSTILDSITLALFNKVPRLDGKKGSGDPTAKNPYKRLDPRDTANCLTRGEKKGYVKLFFECNGEEYLAMWFCQLDKVKFSGERKLQIKSVDEDGTERWDDVITPHKLLDDEFSKRTDATVAKEVQNIMGLGYEQYCKACVLAQNSFATFLKAEDNEKTELLEKLTGTGIYQIIASVIADKKKAADNALTAVESEIGPYRDNIKKNIEDFRKEASGLTEESNRLKDEKAVYKDNLDWNKEKRDADKAVDDAKAKLQEAKEAADLLSEDRKRLAEHDSTAKGVNLVKEAGNRKTELETAKKTLADAIKDRDDNASNIRKKIDERNEKETDLANARTGYEAVKNDEGLVENWTLIAQHYNNLNHQMTAIRNEAGKYPDWIIDGVAESAIVDTALDMVRCIPSGADAQSLSSAVTLAGKRVSACDDAKTLHDSMGRISSLGERNISISGELERLEPILNELKAEEKRWDDQITALTLQDYVKARQSLEDGSPCPLCGAVHHPYSSLEGQVSEALEKALSLATANRNDAKKLREESEGAEKKLNIELSGNESTIKTLSKSHGSLRSSIQKAFPEMKEVFDTTDDAIIMDRLKALFDSRDGQVSSKEEAEKNVKLFDLKIAVDGYIESRDILNGYLHDGWIAERDTDQKTLQENLLERKKKYTEAKKLVDDITSAISTIDAEKGVYEGNVENLENKVSEATSGVTAKETALGKAEGDRDSWIAEYNSRNGADLTVEKLAVLAGDDTDWETIRTNISKADAAVNTATGSLKTSTDSQKKLEEDKRRSSLTDEELNALVSAIAIRMDGDGENAGITARLTELSNTITLHEQAEQKVADTKDALEDAKHKCNLWNRFYGMLEDRAGGGKEGKEFRRMAQNYTLSLLIRYANEQLDIFNKRYTLKKQNDRTLEIMVVDHWKGDDERYASSLSGGETFVISLALALALSKISSGAVTLTNLFIDEGFGTLDADYQKKIIEAMHGLRAQGKKVGIISHTSALLQDDDIFKIRVVKDGTSGKSVIEF